MKIEKRGKYAGVKVHLDKDQVEGVLAEIASIKTFYKSLPEGAKEGKKFKERFSTLKELVDSITTLLQADPTTLLDRSEEEIKEMLLLEQKAAGEKLSLMEKGKDWKKATKAAMKEADKSSPAPAQQATWVSLNS